jgi:endogenous inhibitor of DNA gyrase (YacG/DUF329 family)
MYEMQANISPNLGQLDPTSTYYRICPECSKQHMVTHRGRDFCSDRCADNWYNRRRKLEKQVAVTKVEKGGFINELHPVQNAHSGHNDESAQDSEMQRQANLDYLNSLVLDPFTGSEFDLDELINNNFDFSLFNYRFLLHNTNSKSCYCLTYGRFRIFLIARNKILITTKK